MWQRFTERARRVILLAQEEATKVNSSEVGTEHLLLALVREEESMAVQVLQQAGITREQIQQKFAASFAPSYEPEIRPEAKRLGFTRDKAVDPRLTPQSKRVLELSADEARRFRHNYIGTEHLLLALIRENDGLAAGVLSKFGLSLEDMRLKVLEYLPPETEQETKGQQKQPDISLQPKQHPYLPLLEALIPALDEVITAISENDTEKIEATKQTLIALRGDLQIRINKIK